MSVAASNITKCFQCFKEGTLVETEEGLKPIEEIEVGDKVLAYDEATGEQAYKPVVQLFRNTTEEWYRVNVNGEEIVCTGGHPFYVVNAEAERRIVQFEGDASNGKGAWICANELRIGDKLLLANGTVVTITAMQVERLDVPQTTYNFEVSEAHTYYVSDSKILVHNMCQRPQQPDRITGYTKHGLNQVLGRDGHGVSPKGILDAFQNSNEVVYEVGRNTFKFIGNNSTVVLNQQGKVVTAWAKNSMFWRIP